MYQKGRAWAEIDTSTLIHNMNVLRGIVGEHTVPMPVLKGNAYGHGAPEIGRALNREGVRNFCVACLSEAIELREAGVEGDILVLGYTYPDCFPELYKYDLTQAIVSLDYAKQMSSYEHRLKGHVAIDTGMHRIGERFEDKDRILAIWSLPNIDITGVFSHLCVANEPEPEFKEFSMRQLKAFTDTVQLLHDHGIRGFKTHIQATHGVFNHRDIEFDFARFGIGLYGGERMFMNYGEAPLDLRPVLSLRSRIEVIREVHKGEGIGYGLTYTADRDCRIAAVCIGYADGLKRSLSNKGYCLIHGKKVPIRGRLCMDQLMTEVTEVPEAKAGDVVTFIGDDGELSIMAEDVAALAGTNAHDILTCIGPRVPRIYI